MSLRRTTFLIGIVYAVASASVAAGPFSVSPLTADHTVPPGSVVTDRLLVINNSDEAASFSITAQDFTTDAAGIDAWRPLGSHSRSLGDWITFAPSFVTIPPRGEAYVDYEIRVPGTGPSGLDHPEGSYWAAIQVRADRKRQSLAEPGKSRHDSRFGLRVAFVYAIKLYVSIDGTERPSLRAAELRPGEQPGTLVASFTNTGNVILRPKVWLEIRDLSGSIVARMNSRNWTLQSETLESGEEAPTPFGHDYVFSIRDLPEPLPDGQYVVAVIADHGGPRLLGLTAPLHLSAADGL